MKSHSGDYRAGLLKPSMRPLLALVGLWASLDACLAEEAVASRHGSNSSGAQAAELSSEKMKEAFTKEQCNATVKKVQDSGRYTEESILPICNEIMKSPKCDFFAEALSLASSHETFDPERFCMNMDEAHFCSDVMDKLLMSTPVSDLAFGECERAQKTPDEARCRKMKKMLAYAVENEDLDTFRACYMQEAFTNMTMGELKDNEKSTNVRIIATSSKELENAGKGRDIAYNPNMGNPDIVLRPVPLENMGEGKGNLTVNNLSAAPAAGALQNQTGSIITEPIPAGTNTNETLVAPPAPAAAATLAPPTTIIAVPKPAQAAVATQTVVTRIVAAPTPAPGAMLLHARNSTAAVSTTPKRAVKQQEIAVHIPPAVSAKPTLAAAAGRDADQSLVPKITAVQIVNSTKAVEKNWTRADLEHQKNQLLQKYTDQLKSVMAKVHDPQTLEHQKKKVQTMLHSLQEKEEKKAQEKAQREKAKQDQNRKERLENERKAPEKANNKSTKAKILAVRPERKVRRETLPPAPAHPQAKKPEVIRPVTLQNGASNQSNTSSAPKRILPDQQKASQLSKKNASSLQRAQTSGLSAHAAPKSDATAQRAHRLPDQAKLKLKHKLKVKLKLKSARTRLALRSTAQPTARSGKAASSVASPPSTPVAAVAATPVASKPPAKMPPSSVASPPSRPKPAVTAAHVVSKAPAKVPPSSGASPPSRPAQAVVAAPVVTAPVASKAPANVVASNVTSPPPRPAAVVVAAPVAPAKITNSTGRDIRQHQSPANSTDQVAASSAAPVAQVANRSAPASGAAHRRTGLAQARKKTHKEEIQKEAKGDYSGFLSKFVAA